MGVNETIAEIEARLAVIGAERSRLVTARDALLALLDGPQTVAAPAAATSRAADTGGRRSRPSEDPLADLPSDHPRRRILALVATKSRVWTSREIAEAMKLEPSQVLYQLRQLVDLKLVTAQGKTSSRTYSPS